MGSEIGSELSSAQLLSPGEYAFAMVKAVGIRALITPHLSLPECEGIFVGPSFMLRSWWDSCRQSPQEYETLPRLWS